MKITLIDLPKVSLNQHMHLHWTKKKAFKDNLRLLLMSSGVKQLTGGYHLHFKFTFIGTRLDTINVSHYCKVIEDYIFKQDKENRQICIEVDKGKENKCILELTKI